MTGSNEFWRKKGPRNGLFSEPNAVRSLASDGLHLCFCSRIYVGIWSRTFEMVPDVGSWYHLFFGWIFCSLIALWDLWHTCGSCEVPQSQPCGVVMGSLIGNCSSGQARSHRGMNMVRNSWKGWKGWKGRIMGIWGPRSTLGVQVLNGSNCSVSQKTCEIIGPEWNLQTLKASMLVIFLLGDKQMYPSYRGASYRQGAFVCLL